MDHLIPPLAELLAPLRGCFRQEAFGNFQHVLVAWLLCPGPRTLTEVWQACSLSGRRHFSLIYHLFAAARWDWDELGAILCLLLITHLVPQGIVWLAVDDTLCHRRGKRVAFAGMFLDPVLSSSRRKVFSHGVNWVVLGLVVCLPWRRDRYHCLAVLWRVFRKRGAAGHRKRTQLAAELVRLAAGLAPHRDLYLVADNAYVNAGVLAGRPANVQVIGPVTMKAALYAPPRPKPAGRRGRQPKKGPRLPTPARLFADTVAHPAEVRAFTFPGGARRLSVQQVKGVLWYSACKERPVQVVLVRDPDGVWQDLALLCTDPAVAADEVVQGYARRWGIEVLFRDSKQHLGLQDPQVRADASVARAHPLAWFAYSVTLLWYTRHGAAHEAPARVRPWYRRAARPAFAEVLGTLRLALWRGRYFGGTSDPGGQPPTPELVQTLLHCLAAVR